ncbi:MAG: S24/S26 family peptidase [Clostridia bacterium]
MKPNASHEQIEMRLLLPFFQELLAEGKKIRMTVTGTSMYPLLRDRQDSVLLSAGKQPRRYDIVLFVRDTGDAVLHRIVECRKEGFILLGDNQLEKEGPIRPEQIVAVVDGFYHGEHYVDCSTWWYRLYSVVWSRAGQIRRWLLPLVIRCGRRVKRMERMEK